MRTSTAIIASAIVLLIGGCTSNHCSTTQMAANFINKQHIVTTTKKFYPAKNPQDIALYTNEHKPLSPYRIIGIATISKRNLMGTKRQDETLDTMMKNLAASIGGDALIKISNNDDDVKANVIQYQRILL